MERIPFWKVESVGNDFVLIHRGAVPAEQLTDFALKSSARRFGVGSDGLLEVASEDGLLHVRMFNPDGTEDFCGNGIRCAVMHAIQQGWADERLTVRHLGHTIDAVRLGEVGRSIRIAFTLDAASYRPEDVPLDQGEELFDQPFDCAGRSYRASSLSTGTAHTIFHVDELPGDAEFLEVSPLVEHHPLFPERTSLMWTKEESPNRIRLRIWERGAGETFGCGTGSTAAAIDYLRRKGAGGQVTVVNPGGELIVETTSWQDRPTITGSAEESYTGEFFYTPT